MENMEKTKKEKQKLEFHLAMRVTSEEREILKNKAKHSGYENISTFLRKMALDGMSVRVSLEDFSDISRIAYLISTATNNINQVAKHVNETATVYSKDIQNLKAEVSKMQTQIAELDILIKTRLNEQADKVKKLLEHINM